MTFKTIVSAAGSDDITWTLEQDDKNQGRFRITYGLWGGERVTTTVDLDTRLLRRQALASASATTFTTMEKD